MTAKKASATKAKVKSITKDSIISMYMEYVLENERVPLSVYKFCKENDITETEFYNFFGTFDGLRKEIWSNFYTYTITLIHKSEGYAMLSNQDKLLTFYYTFFEMLTANRSYVLFTLKEHREMMKNMEQLKGLRRNIKSFAGELIESANENKPLKITKQPVSIFSEGAWLQTLFILKFWMDDNSAQFEKTDVVIEKSVRAVFDLFETTPLESVLDFGKFLWKEKMA